MAEGKRWWGRRKTCCQDRAGWVAAISDVKVLVLKSIRSSAEQ